MGLCVPQPTETIDDRVYPQLLMAEGYLNHYLMILFYYGSIEDVVSQCVVQRAKLDTLPIYMTIVGSPSGLT